MLHTHTHTHLKMSMVVYTFNPSTWEAEFEASLVYRASYRIAKATERNPV